MSDATIAMWPELETMSEENGSERPVRGSAAVLPSNSLLRISRDRDGALGWPAAHGKRVCQTEPDMVNRDLLAFIKGEPLAASTPPERSAAGRGRLCAGLGGPLTRC